MALVTLAAGCGDVASAPPPAPEATDIRIDPSDVTLTVGKDSQVVAVVSDAHGNVLSSKDVRWNSVDASIFSVTQAGMIHAVSPGTSKASAVTGAHIALITVTVVTAPSAHASP